MAFLLLIPVFFVLAQGWVSWQARPRKAPQAEQTIGAHQRALAALAVAERDAA
jgi:hypothetical protein